MDQIKIGDMALIVGAKGSQDLIGQCVEVLALHNGLGDAYFCGRCFSSLYIEPAAFIELQDGSIWLWSVSNLMKLRGAQEPERIDAGLEIERRSAQE